MDDQLSDDERSRSARGNGQASRPPEEEATMAELSDTSTVPSSSAPPTGPFYSRRLKVTVAAVAVASVAAMSWIYLRTVDSDRTATNDVAPGVEAVQPAQGSQVPDQTFVGLDLTPGWDGTLTVNDVQIPEDELTRARQEIEDGSEGRPTVEDRLEFAPGPGKVLERLPSGNVCVSARLHHRADPGREQTFDWCFAVF